MSKDSQIPETGSLAGYPAEDVDLGSLGGAVHVQWHAHDAPHTIDRSEDFKPGWLGMWVNFSGGGSIREKNSPEQQVASNTVIVGAPGRRGWLARRHSHQQHRYLSVRISRQWLGDFSGGPAAGAEILRLQGTRRIALGSRVRQITEEVVQQPVGGPLGALWLQAKAVELLTSAITAPEEEFFCTRQKWMARERVARVKEILASNLENPPRLPALGRAIGCSPFYLSRTFSDETGQTISAYLRDLRLDKAAELLRTGRYNVTEAAFEVGYSSLSHFSRAFTTRFGACPCTYPMPGHRVTAPRSRRIE